MDAFAILILTALWSLALITLCQIPSALWSLIFIIRKNKNIAHATFILSCCLVTWNLAVSAMLAKGWGWKMYWPIFASTCGVTFCIIYAIFHYNPPPPVCQTKLGLFDHLNSHQLINFVKGLFNYVRPRCRRPENANVAPSHLKDLSPAAVERPKKLWWSTIWLALISPDYIAYTIINASMCLLLWTLTIFDMVTMNSGSGKVWSSFVKTCGLTAPMIFMIYVDILMDNSPQPISHTRSRPLKGLFDPLNPSLGKGLFNHVTISRRRAESAENATVASYQPTDLGSAVIECPNVTPDITPDISPEKGEGKSTQQEGAEVYAVGNNDQSKCLRNKTDLEEEVYAVENNEQSKCQRNEADLDDGWEIIEEAETNESSIELRTIVI